MKPSTLLTIALDRQLVATHDNGFPLAFVVFQTAAFATSRHWLRPVGSTNAPSLVVS